MKTIFARLLIVWLIAGQILYFCLAQNNSGEPSLLELEYARSPSPATKTALEKELVRVTDYKTKRAIGITTLLLALDGMVIGCFGILE